jgi:hypothetical protein
MPKFQISGYSRYFSSQAAITGVFLDTCLSVLLPVFLIEFYFRAVSWRTAVQIFASESPDSPQIALTA